MRISQLVAAGMLAVAAVTLTAPPAAAEPFLCVYTDKRTVAFWTVRPMEVCVL